MHKLESAPNTKIWHASVDCVTKLVRHLDPRPRTVKSVEVARQLFTLTRATTDQKIDSETFASLLQNIDSIPTLIDLLREPDCVGGVKDAILYRLEQLADPLSPAQAAGLAGIAAALAADNAVAVALAADDARRRRDRRFRTASDAAAWVAQYHPEIDLARPYSLPA